MRIISYNVNGIRSAMSKGLTSWMVQAKPQILALQEIKATPDQLDLEIFKISGYHTHWLPAQKKGYSGVAFLTTIQPDNIFAGCGIPEIDSEGRILRADFGDTTVLSVYLPSGTTGELRQGFKMEVLAQFSRYVEDLLITRPKLVISGDFNICHHPIDIHDPKGNAKSSGFLPEEREWLSSFLDIGFTDSFRHLHPSHVKYSWWSYRAGARANNKGWRIDYNMVSNALKDNIEAADCLNDAMHSDHCPILLDLKS